MRCLVTGAAGFIGSHICQRLLEDGFSVTGIDIFTDFYPKWIKENNISLLQNKEKFKFISGDINGLNLDDLMEKTDLVFHLAAQAGVRTSWGRSFSIYTKNNIETTQNLLEAAKDKGVKKFVYASSSSVYGVCPELPMKETSSLRPYSPYGVTKLAAEHLCGLYFKNYGVPAVSLRYFTVYGPRQRPDMAFHRFFKASIDNKPIFLFGDGKQTRDFTYIDDIVGANIAASREGTPGEIYNIGGGSRIELVEIFPKIEKICGKKIKIKKIERQRGDVLHTFADTQKAKTDLDYIPRVSLEEGLLKEWIWLKNLYSI